VVSTDDPTPLDTYRGFNIRMSSEPEHVPHRPAWTCQCCSEEWPCPPARESLERQHAADPTVIAMLMWMRLEEYSLDQGPGPLSVAFDRFIAWTRPRGVKT
jgi:hypothetical protein